MHCNLLPCEVRYSPRISWRCSWLQWAQSFWFSFFFAPVQIELLIHVNFWNSKDLRSGFCSWDCLSLPEVLEQPEMRQSCQKQGGCGWNRVEVQAPLSLGSAGFNLFPTPVVTTANILSCPSENKPALLFCHTILSRNLGCPSGHCTGE